MAATDTAVPRGARTPDPVPPRRPLRGRLSAGHVVVVVAGLVAVVLNYALLRAGDERVPVAVAARAITPGEPLDAAAVGTAEVDVDDALLAALVPADEVTTLDGHVAAVALAPGDPLRRSDLRAPSASDGRRAMSLPLPAEHAVAGRLQRGDRVDVIAVRDGTADYVLTDAEVLAVAGGDSGGLTGATTFSVTVAVDADEALTLAEAIRGEAVEVVRSTGADAVAVPGPDSDQDPDQGGGPDPREGPAR